MKKHLLITILFCWILLIHCATGQKSVQPAPNFSLTDVSNRVVTLSDFKGKNVVLVFYVNHR